MATTAVAGSVEGQLGLGTLPALIRRLYQERQSGILHIEGEGASTRVYFRWGEVIFANSDRKADRLDKRLAAERALSSKTLLLAYDEQKRTGRRFGECLVAMGALTESELLEAVERQVRAVVTHLFSVTRGRYHFEPMEDPVDDDLMLDVPMQEILLDGIRSMKDSVALRIAIGSMTDILHLSRERHGKHPDVDAAEAFVLSRIDGRASILELISLSPLEETETLKSIAALLAVGWIEARPRTRQGSAKPKQPAPRIEKPPHAPVASETNRELSARQKSAAAEQRYQEGRRFFAERRFYEAITALTDAVRLAADRAPYHRLLGEAYSMNPKWRSSAIEHLEEAVRLDAFDARAHFLLGELYEQRGRSKDARSQLEAALSLDPAYERAATGPDERSALTRLKSWLLRKTGKDA